jgi:MATE family, multidrug efflux pump
MDAEAREIRRKFTRMVWPVIIQNILLTFMFNIDTAMVGRLHEESLAAMGIIGPVRWAIMAIVMGVAIGVVAIVARSVGEKNMEKARTFGATAFVLGIFAGIYITFIVSMFAFKIPTLFTSDKIVIEEAGRYIKITFLIFPLTVSSIIGANILRAAGDTRSPMVITVFSNLLNIFGNWLLIFGNWGFPHLGLYGAGVSTAISKSIEGILMTIYLFTPWSKVRMSISSFRSISMDTLNTLLKVSLPASAEPIFVNLGFLIFTKMVASLGTFAMAANRIALAVESISFMPGHAFSTTCATLVGQKMGEKSAAGIDKSVKHSLTVSVIVMGGLGLVFLIFPTYLAKIFTNDPKLISAAGICLMIGAAEQPFIGMSQIFKGYFHGSGDTVSPIYIGAIGVWGPRLVLSYLLAIYFGLGLTGIWIATTADWITRAFLYFIIYRKKSRKMHAELKPATVEN